MNKQFGILIILGSLFLIAAPQAGANDNERSRYDSMRPYRSDLRSDRRRDKHMPHWLRHDDGFRYWYRRSSLKRNYYFAWPQLFEIYRWERRYSRHQSRHDYHSHRNRSYDWYRRYWRDYEHRQRPRRKVRNRHRDDHY